MNNQQKQKKLKSKLRSNRVRIKLSDNYPRLSIYRSLNHLYAQIIDDKKGQTICSAFDGEVKGKDLKPMEKAEKIGEIIAKKALDNKIKKVVFDRGRFRYHGQVKALAEAAKKAGLNI